MAAPSWTAVAALQQASRPAANQIQAFINQVQDLVSDNILTEEQVETPIADTQGVLEVMQWGFWDHQGRRLAAPLVRITCGGRDRANGGTSLAEPI